MWPKHSFELALASTHVYDAIPAVLTHMCFLYAFAAREIHLANASKSVTALQTVRSTSRIRTQTHMKANQV